MSNKPIILGIVIILAVLWPFSCTPQSGVVIGGGDGCDTIYVESAEAEALNVMIARLTDENKALNDGNKGLKQQLADCNATVATQTATIATQQSTIKTLEDKVTELENRPPETVIDTVEVEADFITVGGVEYKVADIELILPEQTVDTLEMFFCTDVTGDRDFIHEGLPTNYPHFINVASKSRGMVKVWFETPLDSTIKVAKSWSLRRIRSHKEAKTELTFIKSTPL